MLTAHERKAIHGILVSEFHDGNPPVGNWVWSWSCNNFPKTRQFAGAVSSLIKKGFVESDGASKDLACLRVTEAFAKIAVDIYVDNELQTGGAFLQDCFPDQDQLTAAVIAIAKSGTYRCGGGAAPTADVRIAGSEARS